MSDDFPLPDTSWEPTRPFWEAAARGELAIPRCGSCGRLCWYPAERCRACDAERLVWTALSGRGTLFSWAVVERGWVKGLRERAPYVAALVALEEDACVRLVSNLVGCEPAALRMEMPLRVVFRPLPFPDPERQVIAPMFAPAA